MFTGIIGSIGIIESADQQGDLRIKVACDYKPDSLRAGDSVAVNGACLTVIAKGFLASGKTYFTASLSQETLRRTAPGQWEKGRRVNLERALKMGDTLDGHLVTGHVDGIAIIKDMSVSGDSHVACIEAPETLARFIAEKGSVALDGVSLTVNKVEVNPVSRASGCTGAHDGNKTILRNRINDSQDSYFWVTIIPHTWQHTTFSERKPGDGLNLEIDLIARYVARLTA